MSNNISKEIIITTDGVLADGQPSTEIVSDEYEVIADEQLPPAIQESLKRYPELIQLLQGAAEYDSSIVLHCLTVDAMVQNMLNALFLRYPCPEHVQQKVLQDAGWVIVHDLGKDLIHEKPAVARGIYYPVHHIHRPIPEMGLHWTHSVTGALLFANWAEMHPLASNIPVNTWVKHIAAHHYNLRRFLANPEFYAELQSGFHAIIQYFFKLADVAAATGFPRENAIEESPQKIKEILLTKWLTESMLAQHFPFTDASERQELKFFLLTALFESYEDTRHTLPDSAWLGKHPVRIHPEVDMEQSLERFNHLLKTTTDQHQAIWWGLINTMVMAGVFKNLVNK